jgi:hypothetical protein
LLKAEFMQTVYLENRGGKGFSLHALPLEAQYAPVYGIVAADINHDGKKDILLAGNNTWTRIKFGRYSANHGILLLGNGKSGFTYVPQWQSGLNLRGDIRTIQPIVSNNKIEFLFGANNDTLKVVHPSNSK